MTTPPPKRRWAWRWIPLRQSAAGDWFRLLLFVGMLLTLGLGAYVLSVGPVLWFYEARQASGWRGVPSFVQHVYFPLKQVAQTNPRVAQMLDDYVRLWIGSD